MRLCRVEYPDILCRKTVGRRVKILQLLRITAAQTPSFAVETEDVDRVSCSMAFGMIGLESRHNHTLSTV
jgi:hypothetical protein